MAHGASSLAYHDNKVVFVQGALPEERVDVEITRDSKRYSIARIKRILKASPLRVPNECPYSDCGACDFRYVDPKHALAIKAEAAFSELKKAAGGFELGTYSCKEARDHDASRRRVRLHAEGDKLGFFAAGSHRLVPIHHCLAMHPKLQDTLTAFQSASIFRPGGKGEILLELDAADRAFAVIYAKNPKDCRIEVCKELLKQAVIAGFKIGEKVFGEAFVKEMTARLACYHKLGAFMQANAEVNAQIHDAITEILNFMAPKRVIDAFAGCGNFSFCAARVVPEVLAYERYGSKEGFNRGRKENASLLMKPEALHYELIDLDAGLPTNLADAIILDPPRHGLSAKFCDDLVVSNIARIIYISCDPIVLGRDIGRLATKYKVSELRFFDMFPRTSHIEALCVLDCH